MKWLLLAGYLILLILLFFPFGDLITRDIHIQPFFCHEHNCSATLIHLFETYIPQGCAFYDVNLDEISNYFDSFPVIMDRRTRLEHTQPFFSRGLMHHKFCFFEEDLVFTGGWNPTWRETYLNDNYQLLLFHPDIRAAYEEEFIYLQGGPTPSSFSTRLAGGGRLSLYFCPHHSCEEQVLSVLETATSIDALFFTFTSQPIADALALRVERGATLRAVFERRQLHLTEHHQRLAAVGGAIRLDQNPATMHGKLFIVNNDTLIVGSYNPTAAGTQRNNENLLIISGREELVMLFYQEFKRIWEMSVYL